MNNEHEEAIPTLYNESVPAQAEPGEAHTTVAPTEHSVAATLGLRVNDFGAQLINFTIVTVVVWFLILKPLTKKMTERQEIINASLDNAEKVQKNLEESEKQFNAKINEAKSEANKLLEKAHTDATVLGNEMKDKAKAEIETLVEQAKKNIRIEKDEMVAGLKKETADLVIAVVEKVLAEKMTDKKDKEMIGEMVTKMKA